MLDVAIVGGGLSGLALARRLGAQGRTVALFEARERLGGRIMTDGAERGGLAMDLGATWFWPEAQPLMSRAVAECGLAHFPQFEDGDILQLADPDAAPAPMEAQRIPQGAYRIEGGMVALVYALAGTIPDESVWCGHALVGVLDRGDHVELSFAVGNRTIEWQTRHVALALPPRLIAQDVRFDPPLDEAAWEALRDARTWMASRAKAVMGFERAFWREAGHSGSAFVTHQQAALGEMFDACDAHGGGAALGGILALSAEQRVSFRVGLPLVLESQVVQVFGNPSEAPALHYQDWALEPFTCSALDLESPADERLDSANPLLRRAMWGGKLFFGGAETAARDAGLLEGALQAAQRIERDLVRFWAALGRTAEKADPRAIEPAATNAASLAQFGAWVAVQIEETFDEYRRRLRSGLAAQQREQLTQRALLGAMEDLFARALAELEGLEFNAIGVTVELGRSSLTPLVQRPFGSILQSVVDDALAFNRSSCALSNFPDEHRPSKEYMQVILRDIAAAWQEFSLSANRLLLARTDARQRGAA